MIGAAGHKAVIVIAWALYFAVWGGGGCYRSRIEAQREVGQVNESSITPGVYMTPPGSIFICRFHVNKVWGPFY